MAAFIGDGNTLVHHWRPWTLNQTLQFPQDSAVSTKSASRRPSASTIRDRLREGVNKWGKSVVLLSLGSWKESSGCHVCRASAVLYSRSFYSYQRRGQRSVIFASPYATFLFLSHEHRLRGIHTPTGSGPRRFPVYA